VTSWNCGTADADTGGCLCSIRFHRGRNIGKHLLVQQVTVPWRGEVTVRVLNKNYHYPRAPGIKKNIPFG